MYGGQGLYSYTLIYNEVFTLRMYLNLSIKVRGKEVSKSDEQLKTVECE